MSRRSKSKSKSRSVSPIRNSPNYYNPPPKSDFKHLFGGSPRGSPRGYNSPDLTNFLSSRIPPNSYSVRKLSPYRGIGKGFPVVRKVSPRVSPRVSPERKSSPKKKSIKKKEYKKNKKILKNLQKRHDLLEKINSMGEGNPRFLQSYIMWIRKHPEYKNTLSEGTDQEILDYEVAFNKMFGKYFE